MYGVPVDSEMVEEDPRSCRDGFHRVLIAPIGGEPLNHVIRVRRPETLFSVMGDAILNLWHGDSIEASALAILDGVPKWIAYLDRDDNDDPIVRIDAWDDFAAAN